MRKEIKQQQHQQQEYPSQITSFLKRFSVKFQEVEKGNLQIKEKTYGRVGKRRLRDPGILGQWMHRHQGSKFKL